MSFDSEVPRVRHDSRARAPVIASYETRPCVDYVSWTLMFDSTAMFMDARDVYEKSVTRGWPRPDRRDRIMPAKGAAEAIRKMRAGMSEHNNPTEAGQVPERLGAGSHWYDDYPVLSLRRSPSPGRP